MNSASDLSRSRRRTEEALQAAQWYYQDDVAMEEIAQRLGTSRSTVSRLLSYARETGLVEIRVLPPHSRVSELEELISTKYTVQASVVHVPATATAAERIERTAIETARLLGTVFDSDMIMGISWGTMVNAVSQYLAPKATTNTQIVQLNGFGNPRSAGVHYANTLMASFAEAFGSHVQQLPLPLFFDSAKTRNLLFQERSIRRITELQAAADVVLFNVGTVVNGVPASPYMSGYFLEDAEVASLKEDGAVGDIATTFIRADGTHERIRFNRRTSGPDPTVLKQVKHRICATSGDHKIEALRAALLGGFVNTLVIDEVTAEALLDRSHNGAG